MSPAPPGRELELVPEIQRLPPLATYVEPSGLKGTISKSASECILPLRSKVMHSLALRVCLFESVQGAHGWSLTTSTQPSGSMTRYRPLVIRCTGQPLALNPRWSARPEE